MRASQIADKPAPFCSAKLVVPATNKGKNRAERVADEGARHGDTVQLTQSAGRSGGERKPDCSVRQKPCRAGLAVLDVWAGADRFPPCLVPGASQGYDHALFVFAHILSKSLAGWDWGWLVVQTRTKDTIIAASEGWASAPEGRVAWMLTNR